jgi:outer membrane protein insertion porin family
VTAIKRSNIHRPVVAALLAGTVLSGAATAAQAQDARQSPTPAPVPAVAPAPVTTIKTLSVSGQQRLEPDTILSYQKLRQGQPYTRESLDQALRDLYETELFADVQISGAETGDIVIQVKENPVITRKDFVGAVLSLNYTNSFESDSAQRRADLTATWKDRKSVV